jgi:hypothetical protein
MKNLILAILMLASTTAFSQGFQFGLKAGANFSNFVGSDDIDDLEKNTYVGFHGGAFVAFLLGDHLALQPELLFSTQGTKFKYAGNETKYTVSYINVPIMVKYRFTGGFFLEAGPQFGFKVNEDTDDMQIDDFAESVDVSAAAGLGYHSSVGLGIGARYSVGISKAGDFTWQGASNPNYRNSNIQVYLFYTFFNNKK